MLQPTAGQYPSWFFSTVSVSVKQRAECQGPVYTSQTQFTPAVWVGLIYTVLQENSTEAYLSHTPVFNDVPGTSWVFSLCSVDKQKSVCFPETC